MFWNMSERIRARLVGVLLILAFSMLTYVITKVIIAGAIMDIISGLAVIFIPLLMYPVFNSSQNRFLNLSYLSSKIIEGLLMIVGGVFIFFPTMVGFRAVIYQDIHIYFFITGAILKYVLFYRTQAVPRFISVWGICAAILLLISTIINLTRPGITLLGLLLLPIVINEFFLAGWLIIRGFDANSTKMAAPDVKKVF